MLGFRPAGYRGPAMLETRQLHPTLAWEVVGLSLWQTLDDATVAELRDLYAQYGVLGECCPQGDIPRDRGACLAGN
jgi:hypothetical protein